MFDDMYQGGTVYGIKTKYIYIASIIAAFAISIGLGAMVVRYQGQGESYAPRSPKSTSQTDPVVTSSSIVHVTGQNTGGRKSFDTFSEIPQQTGALTALDLSLGKLSIGDDMDKVRAILGTPKSSRLNEYGSTVYKFDSMEVVFQQDNKVIALVSESALVSTPRGIHDGSPAEEVFAMYGNNYSQSAYGGLKLYEYDVTSKDGRACILRFAIRGSDATVDYISMRAR